MYQTGVIYNCPKGTGQRTVKALQTPTGSPKHWIKIKNERQPGTAGRWKNMIILTNNYDPDINFENLEKAKKYYYPSEEDDKDVKNPDNYIGDMDFNDYLKSWEEYKKHVEGTETLEELANVLNRYADIFGNGSEYIIKNI